MNKPLTYESDEALLKDLRNGASQAFEALYRQYYRMVAKQAADAGVADTEAEDIFQEVLFVLVRKVRDPEFRLNAKLSTFLFAVARNLLLKKAGKKYETAVIDSTLIHLGGQQLPEDPADIKTREEQLNVVTGYLELLEEDCHEVLMLSFYEKRSHAEIAGIMGYAASFVKVKKHRCLEYLRKQVKTHPLFKHLQ